MKPHWDQRKAYNLLTALESGAEVGPSGLNDGSYLLDDGENGGTLLTPQFLELLVDGGWVEKAPSGELAITKEGQRRIPSLLTSILNAAS